MNWISRLIGETTTASAIPAAGPGSGFGGAARLKFKKKKPQTTIEKLIGTGSGGKPTAPDSNPERDKKEPKPDSEKKQKPEPEPLDTKPNKDEEKPDKSIIPPSADEVGTDGIDRLDQRSLTRADRAVLDLFMPKPKQTADAGLPATPAVSEAAVASMLGLGDTSIPSGPMPEHTVSEDGAAKVLEAMHRFTSR